MGNASVRGKSAQAPKTATIFQPIPIFVPSNHALHASCENDRQGRGVSRAMKTPKTKLHRNRSLVVIVVILLASLAALLTLAPQTATAFDPLNPFNTFTDSGPVTPEEREQRQQLRADLYDRL